MKKKQQSNSHSLRCHFCGSQIPVHQLVSHQTHCSIKSKKRNSQRPTQQQQRNQQVPRQQQQRNRQTQNAHQVIFQEDSDDSLEYNQSDGFAMPDFNQIFGPNSQFQRSMNNMAQQMNQAFNISLNIGQQFQEVNINTGNQNFHYVNQQPRTRVNIVQFCGSPDYEPPSILISHQDYSSQEEDSFEGIHLHNFGEYQPIYYEVENEQEQGRPLNSQQIHQIPVQKYSKNSQNKNCIICLTDFKVSDPIKILECSHTFHQKCIDQWLKQKGECPVCRHKLH